MPMGVHTPHTKLSISGFGPPIGENDPRQGQNYLPLNGLAQICPFLTLKTLFSGRVRKQSVSSSPVLL